MASRVIGRLPVVYYPQTGKLEVENTAEFVEKQIYQRMDDLAHGQPLHITLTVEPVNNGEFDILIRFGEGANDPYYYCFKDEGCHIIYHRFLPEDYTEFDF